MPRRKIFTASVVRQIPRLVDQGLNATEIAECIGCTVGTLRVRSSQLGISLRRKYLNEQEKERLGAKESGPVRKKRSDEAEGYAPSLNAREKMELKVVVPKDTADRLRQQALLKGISYQSLAAWLLNIIARDRLYDAVLDGHDVEEVQTVWDVKV